MKVLSLSIARFAMITAGACLATSCSTGVFFADDNQEGHVGFLSATQYEDVSDVLIVKKGEAPTLVRPIEPEPMIFARISEPTPVPPAAKPDPLLDVEIEPDTSFLRFDVPVIEPSNQPLAEALPITSAR